MTLFRHPLFCLLCFGMALSCTLPVEDQASYSESVTAYRSASVFDGERFIQRDLCIDEAVFVKCPKRGGTEIDLAGLYVTPPFGDAHTHHFDGPFTLEWHISLARDAGVFYAMTMTAPTSGVTQIRDRLDGPGNIDVATSLGGITGPQSHPAEIYEALALGIRGYDEQVARADEIYASRRASNDAYYVVETEDDVRVQLAKVLAGEPDHIKVFLRHSERYTEDWGKWGPGGGINPSLLPLIRQLTTDSDKRLAVAASSISDYRAALRNGADIITHLPCYQDTEADPTSVYYDTDTEDECLISIEEAEQAARQDMIGTIIMTEWVKDRPQKLVDWEQINILRLSAAGAPLAFASNNYGSTIVPGLIAGVEKGFLPPATTLKIATMDTPNAIFPERKVGCLDIGCEASFIAFAENPLFAFSTISDIQYRVKDGAVFETATP